MALKMTVWISALLFVAMIWNVVSAYNAMGRVNVQSRFEQIGLLYAEPLPGFPVPSRKPLQVEEVAAR